MSGVALALAAAACFARSTVAQHRVALTAPTRGPLSLTGRLLRSPLWLAGLVLGAAALALQALALSRGAIVVVQPLLLLGLLLALPLSDALARRRPGVVELAWATAVLAGLGLFLVSAHPARGVDVAPQVSLALATATATAAGVAAAAAAAALRRWRAALLGLAGGALIGAASALLKQVVGLLAQGPTAALAWSLAGVVAAGAAGVLATQAGYAAGHLSASQPAHSIAEPVVAAAIGATAFAEHLAVGPLPLLGQVGGGVLMAAGVVGLALTAPAEVAPAGGAPAEASCAPSTPSTSSASGAPSERHGAGSGRVAEAVGAGVVLAAAGLASIALLRYRAAPLATAGGSSLGLGDGLLKEVVGRLADGSPPAALEHWSLVGLLVAGGAGLVLNQSRYRAGVLTATQPAITITEPVVGAVVGVLAFGERVDGSATGLAVQAVGDLAMGAGVIRLSRLTATRAPRPAGPAPQPAPAGRPTEESPC